MTSPAPSTLAAGFGTLDNLMLALHRCSAPVAREEGREVAVVAQARVTFALERCSRLVASALGAVLLATGDHNGHQEDKSHDNGEKQEGAHAAILARLSS